MSKITFANKSQVGSYDAGLFNAQDANEVKTSVNAAYDAIAALPAATSTVTRLILSQTGTADPVMTMLENTNTNTFTVGRSSAGVYLILASAGTSMDYTKTFITCNVTEYPGVSGPSYTQVKSFNNNEIDIRTKIISTNTPTDSILFHTCIEIIVYP